jgi:hypothetical protein
MATRRRASKNSLTGSITDLQRRVRYLQAKPVPSRLANQVVTRSAIQPRAVDTDQIALDAITNDQIEANAIKQEQIDNRAVGTAQLQDASVQTLQIQDDAVTQDKLAAGSVGNSQLQDNSVGNGQLQENSVNTNEIASGAVDTDQLAGEAVTTDKIRGGAVTRAKIDGLAVGTGEIDDGAVTNEKLAGNITGDKIATNTITQNKIQEDSVGSSEIQPLAVRSTELADSAVTSTKLANSAVTTAKIANSAVTQDKIADGSINSAKTDGFFIRTIGQSSGITVTRSTTAVIIGLSFGTGSQQVPRGNHTHTVNVGSGLEGAIIRTTSGPSASTLKVKKDIQPYKPAEIKNLLKLEPKTYRYKRSERAYHQALNKELMHGYVVEELLDLGFPEPVGYDKDGNPATLDYGLMSLLVLELVKVQQTEIDFLKEEVLRLKDAK